MLPAATLPPGHTYYLGFRANTDASFTLSSSASGAIAIPTNLAFYGGGLTNVSVPAGGTRIYRIDIPADAYRWKSSATSSGPLDWYLEEGVPVDLARVGNISAHAQYFANSAWDLNQPLYTNSWPWLPVRTFYLSVRNTSGNAQVFNFDLKGRTTATDDEDGDGLSDEWETASYGGASYNTYDTTSDPDFDGVPNLLEYALGLDPMTSNSVGMPTIQASGSNLTLNYKRARSDINYAVETTTTLTNPESWTTTGVTQGTPDGDGTTTASVPYTTSSRFLRLRVCSTLQ